MIVAKIQREAEDERAAAHAASVAAVSEMLEDDETEHRQPWGNGQDTRNAQRRTVERPAPEFDAAKWNRLAAEDPDIAAAIASVARYGNYYVADLAASYLAIHDKQYLSRIVSVILAEAEAERSSSANSSSLPFEWEYDTKNSDSGAATRQWAESGESSAHQSNSSSRSDGQNQIAGSFEFVEWAARLWNSGGRQTVGLTVLAAFLVTALGGFADFAYEYSMYRSAQGDVDRLQAYGRQCWICTFKSQSDVEASSLRAQVRIIEEEGRRKQAVAVDEKSFRDAEGNIIRLGTYLQECGICAYADEARQQIARLEKGAADLAQSYQREQAVAVDTTNFLDAQGNVASLEAYLRTCTVCAHADEARQQIARSEDEAAHLEQSRQDEFNRDQRAYFEARDDIGKLIAYLGGCSVCAFKSAAEEQLRQLRKPAQPAEPPRQATWRITNSTGLAIGVLFFSQTRPGHAWPGSNMNWPMPPGKTADYNLACETGENICYGAFAPYRAEFWGVGTYGNQACSNCCFLCDGTVHAINLVLTGNGDDAVE